jgi:hypothetical protein
MRAFDRCRLRRREPRINRRSCSKRAIPSKGAPRVRPRATHAPGAEILIGLRIAAAEHFDWPQSRHPRCKRAVHARLFHLGELFQVLCLPRCLRSTCLVAASYVLLCTHGYVVRPPFNPPASSQQSQQRVSSSSSYVFALNLCRRQVVTPTVSPAPPTFRGSFLRHRL